MTTFLELAKTLRQEAGLSGTGPASVVGQSGMDKKVVDWTNDAWYDIQSARNDWAWMWRNNGLVNTTVGQQTYDLPGLGFDAERVIAESVSIQRTGEPNSIISLDMIPYSSFRDMTAFLPVTSSQPIYCAIAPNDHLWLNTLPDRDYTIKFEWYAKPSFMTGNNDIPALPLPYHRMIVELALMKYASHDGAMEVYQVAEKEYRKWMRRLERSQLPDVETTGALA
jgi:hypothetical protein